MDEDRLEEIDHRFDWPLMLASILVIPVIAIDAAGLGSPWKEISGALNWLSWSVFFAEAVVMLRVSGWRWIRRNPLSLFVTVITAPVLPANLDAVRMLRLARLLRLIPGASAARRLFTLEGVKYAAAIVVATVVLGGVLYSQLETEGDHTALAGIWWALTTITTVGYGDLSPQTPAGKVVAGVVMLVGISFVALVTAFIAERFTAQGAGIESDRKQIDSELAALRSDMEEINRKLDLLLVAQSKLLTAETDSVVVPPQSS